MSRYGSGSVWTIPGLGESGAQARILNAALRCFARRGFAGTSMTDIAGEAGVSRTALYNHYPNLEAVFMALARRVNEGVRRAVQDAAGTRGNLEQRLRAVLEARVGWAFEALHLSDHGRDLIDTKDALCGAQGAATEAEFAKLLARIIEDAGGTGHTVSAGQAGDMLATCLPALIETATSEREARQRVRRFVRLVVRGLSG